MTKGVKGIKKKKIQKPTIETNASKLCFKRNKKEKNQKPTLETNTS